MKRTPIKFDGTFMNSVRCRLYNILDKEREGVVYFIQRYKYEVFVKYRLPVLYQSFKKDLFGDYTRIL